MPKAAPVGTRLINEADDSLQLLRPHWLHLLKLSPIDYFFFSFPPSLSLFRVVCSLLMRQSYFAAIRRSQVTSPQIDFFLGDGYVMGFDAISIFDKNHRRQTGLNRINL